jgi:hypothetical protein
VRDLLPNSSTDTAHPNPSSHDLEQTDSANLFGTRSSDADIVSDTIMDDRLAPVTTEPNIDQFCLELQSKLKLDPEHLKIALLTSKVSLTLINHGLY